MVEIVVIPRSLQTKYRRSLGEGSWEGLPTNTGNRGTQAGELSLLGDPRQCQRRKDNKAAGLGVLQVVMETGSPEFKEAGQRRLQIR